MDENVLAGLALNEAESLARVKPLHCSLFSHECLYFLFVSYLSFSTAVRTKKVKTAETLLENLMVLQDRQTQAECNTDRSGKVGIRGLGGSSSIGGSAWWGSNRNKCVD
jgi:hypothetical protein